MADPKFNDLNKFHTATFLKGMVKDLNDTFLPEGAWTHARNSTVNTLNGDNATLSNESSTLLCTVAPYTVIGYLYFNDDEWIIFSTDGVNHEIGLFTESKCIYTKLVNDPCLNFSLSNPIRSGAVKSSIDCHRYFYWDDGLNPTRYMSPTNIPYVQNCVQDVNGCLICTDIQPLKLDCDKLRLTPFIKVPCTVISKAAYGGELINGSYQACVAYTIDQQRFGDYYALTAAQPIFNHVGMGGAIDIEVSNLDTNYFKEFELVVIISSNGTTIAKRIGFYSTSDKVRIGLSIIQDTLVTIPLSNLPVRRPVYEKSDAVYSVGSYMLRVGPRSRFSFNYQPLANQIKAHYVLWEVPADYYKNGGNLTGYMSDEVYPFFIRYIYNTGERTDSYHIPGRAKTAADTIPFGGLNNFDSVNTWEGQDTSVMISNPNTPFGDPGSGISGTIVARGDMSYWESSERYPNDPVRYGTLCNNPIRHHKFPSRAKNAANQWHHAVVNNKPVIRVLGIEFSNIARPVDNNGVFIEGIVGYEILRGSREGNKTIIAKGIYNNMLTFNDPKQSGSTGRNAIQNFPYNQVNGLPDSYLYDRDNYPGGACNVTTPGAIFNRDQHYSFHSPDTQFKEPFLAPYEMRDYGKVFGDLGDSQFTPVENHPKHKLPSDLAFIISMYLGAAVGLASLYGKRRVTSIELPEKLGLDWSLAAGNGGAGLGTVAPSQTFYLTTILDPAVTTASTSSQLGLLFPITLGNAITGTQNKINASTDYTTTIGNDPVGASLAGAIAFSKANTGMTSGKVKIDYTDGYLEGLPPLLQVVYGVPLFSNYWAEGTDRFLELIMKLVPYRQFAYQFRSHLLYKDFYFNTNNNFDRRSIANTGYIGSGVFQVPGLRIDNTLRNKYVYVGGNVSFDHTGISDNTRFIMRDLITDVGIGTDIYKDPEKFRFNNLRGSTTIYGALVTKLINQYGQLDGINQIPIQSCYTQAFDSSGNWVSSTGPLFGGDIYIGRHTEKNPFFFFRNWLENQRDGAEIDYRKYNTTILKPRFWMDTQQFELSDFVRGLISNITSIFTPGPIPANTLATVPSDFRALDGNPADCSLSPDNLRFGAKNAYMYLFNSGVRDFYVESEINVDQRDWLDEDRYRHYHPYNFTDINILFRPDIIRERELYRYDFSLSTSKIFYDKISWGNIQPRSYDPITYQDCYTYDPDLVIYSLPNNETLIDSWRVYLPLNQKKISGTIVNIKNIDKNGSLILFNDRSPIMIQGSDTLETANAKVVIGDGGLFGQPMQNISSSDLAFMEGSVIDTLGVINCAAGIYIMSNNLKKIYKVSGKGLEDITMKGMKWWFNTYMGYRILDDFPDFPDMNNLAIGLGSYITYDAESSILYFTKRDYRITPGLQQTWDYIYLGKGRFRLVSKVVPGLKLNNISLDSKYFEDVSWTISYDPKQEVWVSFHDWKPNFTLSSKSKFIAIKGKEFWKHNTRFDSFCNFYGVEYPWEIEVPINSGQQVETLKSVEYYIDALVYGNTPDVSKTILDANFDEAIVSNKEQASGLLRLFVRPKNDPYGALNYPINTGSAFNILFSKEENKIRFNQFKDITNDRGEFTSNNHPIFLYSGNGYIKTLNPLAINYNKPPLECKKFRNYFHRIFLRKNTSGNVNFVFKIFNTKNTISPR